MIFVFGSNELGVHGAGAALFAMQRHGAKRGVGFGHVGNSFAIPTKDTLVMTLPLDQIKRYVDEFIAYARDNHELKFQVTQIGCGLAGYTASDIAPLFVDAPSNCSFDEKWRPWLGVERDYWGTI